MYFYRLVCLFVDLFSQLIPQGISPSSGVSKCLRFNLCQFGNEILKKCNVKQHSRLTFIVTRVIFSGICDPIATQGITDCSVIKGKSSLPKFSTRE